MCSWLDLPQEEPHLWWLHGEELPVGGSGLLHGPVPFSGAGWWPWLMALYLPTFSLPDTQYLGGGVRVDGRSPGTGESFLLPGHSRRGAGPYGMVVVPWHVGAPLVGV